MQTPQAFRSSALRQAQRNEPEGTDDASLIEGHGGRIVVVAGDLANLKVTETADLAHVHALLAEDGVRTATASATSAATVRWCSAAWSSTSMGCGPLDADARTAHAVNALLGPAGLPDLGRTLFPASDPRTAGGASVEVGLLEQVVRVREAPAAANVDVVVAAEAQQVRPVDRVDGLEPLTALAPARSDDEAWPCR